jgi:hypothetical protein
MKRKVDCYFTKNQIKEITISTHTKPEMLDSLTLNGMETI